MNQPIVISKPALSAIAASLFGLAEALQNAADNGIPSPVREGDQSAAPEGRADPSTTKASKHSGISLTEVRVLLAGLCQSGKTDEVRDLLTGYGAAKLSQVDPRHYPALVQAAEAL